MRSSRPWVRMVGGGCFLNAAITGLLVGLFATVSLFSVDSIAFPFLFGATVSFGLGLLLIRKMGGEISVMRKVLLLGAGVALGSVLTVIGITVYLLLVGF